MEVIAVFPGHCRTTVQRVDYYVLSSCAFDVFTPLIFHARYCCIRVQFLKKFLHYSKHRIHPELTEGAREHIASAYASLRSKQVG